MLNILRSVAARFADVHAILEKPGFNLVDESGALFGHVDGIAVRGNRIVVEGWAAVDEIALAADGVSTSTAPTLRRIDIPVATGGRFGESVGFSLSVAVTISQLHLVMNRGANRFVYYLGAFDEKELRRSRLWTLLPFLWAVIRTAPHGLRWLLTRNPAAKARIMQVLALRPTFGKAVLLPARLFDDQPTGSSAAITIILPVYNALNLLPEVLERVIKHTDLDWRMIIVEDCSTDPNVRPFLRSWKANLDSATAGKIELLENEQNLGFIRSVNKALGKAIPLGNHVVLLNSDAFVPSKWASRLVEPIELDADVATVTPLSNDAEIFSVPVICKRSGLQPGEADQIDSAIGGLNPKLAQANGPTGVGFCMAMNQRFLEQVRELDTTFGRGYGEEVDWCQKARALGGLHVGIGNLFVEHRGGESFGSAEKLKLVQANNAVIAARYPKYDREVQDYILHDPLSGVRLCAAIAWAARNPAKTVQVFIAHSLGGGAEFYLQSRIAALLPMEEAAIVLRVGGRYRWQIEVHTSAGVALASVDAEEELMKVLAPLGRIDLVYSCGVGHPEPVGLPGALINVMNGREASLEVLFHDYFVVSPSYNLLDGAGRFVGVPSNDEVDPVHETRARNGERVSLADWRREWGKLLEISDNLIVFSASSAKLVAQAYPHIAERITVRPHSLLSEIPVVERRNRSVRTIAVLGNMAPQKGAGVLVQMADEIKSDQKTRLVLIGNLDPTYKLAPPAIVHGSYVLDDLPGLVERYGITDWVIPSVWPETFSYTTHEAIATGLPVWSFDLGAQADAIRSSIASGGQGGVVELGESDMLGRQMLDAILSTKLRAGPGKLKLTA